MTIAPLLVLLAISGNAIGFYFPPSDWDTAACIVEAESRNDATVIGAAGERTAWQIHPRWHEWRFDRRGWDIYNATRIQATAIAFEIWQESGWSQWSTSALCV